MSEVIAAPPAQPPRYGLIASAAVSDGNGARWQRGYTFQPERCAGGGRLVVACEGNTAAMDDGDRPSNVDGEPFVIYAVDECSTFGWTARDWQGRARRGLAAIESYELANELWTGSLNLDGRSLADPAADTLTTGLSAADPIHGLGMLEQGLASCNKGRRGMIHVTPQLLTHLVVNDAVRLDGTTYVSPNGHIVVPDAGYPGTGPNGEPAGATQWAYATSMVSVLQSPVDVTPASFEQARDLAGAMDRAVNDLIVYASRLAGWVWDECCHLAAKIDLQMPLVGGAS